MNHEEGSLFSSYTIDQYNLVPTESNIFEQEFEDNEDFSQRKKKRANIRASVAPRGANFTSADDKLLCQCWLDISQDEVKGNCQKSDKFFARVKEKFVEIDPSRSRTAVALKSRWGIINRAVSKFCGFLSQVENLNQSGTSQSDKFDKAKIMYKKFHEKNHEFKFDECWKVLHAAPKWRSYNEPSPVIPSTPLIPNAVDPSLEISSPQSVERPDGKRKTVETRKKKQANEERMKVLENQHKEIISLTKNITEGGKESRAIYKAAFEQRIMEKQSKRIDREKKNELIDKQMEMMKWQMDTEKEAAEERRREKIKVDEERQRQDDREVMEKNLDEMDEFQRKYWTLEKKRVLKRMEHEGREE